ncbi:GTP cyclohydrolase 1 type 2/Nif3 [Achaetomium macrosporum]|uniref:GTP cyclohydrolase 1 type 2/Nif3 n=1 Tax=Achaetomium macrosporum TaxID=79813 RepID=A0AAN7CIV3_9PEZI|nr:GTP cyclohydrolase 1 type 2/Nif3 [Achaetomium macrosporum]
MEPTLSSPLFTRQVVQAMRSLYPEELADRTWDNVGLLQENIEPASGSVPPRVLLANDLTVTVAEEAIAKQVSVIVSYHPFIFRGLKSVTLNDPHQRIVLRLAQHNIAVYSPHTAVDAALGGVNDWLAGMLNEHGVVKDSVVQLIRGPVPAGFEGAGYGRLVELEQAVHYTDIAKTYADRLGLSAIMIARPSPRCASASGYVRSVAVCAGSGYDVLKDADADLFVTGEMTHHNALRLTMLGKYVITVFHSNSERGFLREVLQPQLDRILKKDDPSAEVLISEGDRDPFEIFRFPEN